jgi:hypothetical protein
MKLTFPRVAPAAIIVGSLSAEAVLQPGLHHERCGNDLDIALCHPSAIEPPNFHTTHRDFEPTPIAGSTWIASGQVNSMTPSRGLVPTDGTLRFIHSGVLLFGDEDA